MANTKTLTQHAYLNTVANLLNYVVTMIVWLVVNPLLLSYLGSSLFGTWKYCQRLLSYAEAADGRATQALKWTLANKLVSDDTDAKRRDIGCALGVWLRFLPFLLLLGGFLSWISPYLIRGLPDEHFVLARLACTLLVLNVILMPLQSIPESVLIGMNVSYKGFGARVFSIVLTGSLMVCAVFIGWSIIGVAASLVCATLSQGIILTYIVKRNFPWVGVSKPGKKEFHKFFSFSVWIFAWTFVARFILGGDVIVLGWITSPEMVTSYVFTIYAIQMIIGFIGFAVGGATPGLGGLVGQKQFEKASAVRSEIMVNSWLLTTIIGSMVLLWNYSFVKLWVGTEQFVGFTETLLMVLLVMQLIFIRNDGFIIDLTLRLKWKVLLGIFSCVISAILAYIFAVKFSSSVIGLVVGFITGRAILTIAYPMIVSNAFEIKNKQHLIPIIRPIIMTIIFFGVSYYLGKTIEVNGWFSLIAYATVSLVLLTVSMFFIGLSQHQREKVMMRIRSINFMGRS